MPVVPIFEARTTNGASTATQFIDNRVVVEIENDSVMAGARLIIQTCSENTPTKFYRTGPGIVMTAPGARTIELKPGMFIRLVLENAGALTSVNANIIT